MLNKILLQGRLVADPELRHTQANTAVASFRLAVDRDFKDRETGERQADFINIVAWRATAEFVSRYFRKGQMAVVDGRLQTRSYTDQDGNRRYTTDVVSDHVYFCGSRQEGASDGFSQGEPPANAYGYDPSKPDAYQDFADITDEDDGELPF